MASARAVNIGDVNEDAIGDVASDHDVVVPRSALAEHLVADAEVRHEPLVMLQVRAGGVAVRRLTMGEKLIHSDRTGGPVFAGSEQELAEMFGLLAEQADQAGGP
jgi:hypothetical protein